MAQVHFTAWLRAWAPVDPVRTSGATVGEALASLFEQEPQLRGYLFDERGALSKHVCSFVDGRRLAREASTGQQKAYLIAVVLAEARVRAAAGDQQPVLLLDEVAAHLDPERRAALFSELSALGAQAWLTGTEAGVFAPLGGRAQFFTVQDSTLKRHDPA